MAMHRLGQLANPLVALAGAFLIFHCGSKDGSTQAATTSQQQDGGTFKTSVACRVAADCDIPPSQCSGSDLLYFDSPRCVDGSCEFHVNTISNCQCRGGGCSSGVSTTGGFTTSGGFGNSGGGGNAGISGVGGAEPGDGANTDGFDGANAVDGATGATDGADPGDSGNAQCIVGKACTCSDGGSGTLSCEPDAAPFCSCDAP